jgi:hypothetical protein
MEEFIQAAFPDSQGPAQACSGKSLPLPYVSGQVSFLMSR